MAVALNITPGMTSSQIAAAIKRYTDAIVAETTATHAAAITSGSGSGSQTTTPPPASGSGSGGPPVNDAKASLAAAIKAAQKDAGKVRAARRRHELGITNLSHATPFQIAQARANGLLPSNHESRRAAQRTVDTAYKRLMKGKDFGGMHGVGKLREDQLLGTLAYASRGLNPKLNRALHAGQHVDFTSKTDPVAIAGQRAFGRQFHGHASDLPALVLALRKRQRGGPGGGRPIAKGRPLMGIPANLAGHIYVPPGGSSYSGVLRA